MTPRPRQPTLLIGLIAMVAMLVALVHVYIHLQLIEAGYAVSRESRLNHELLEQNQRLRLELAVRKDPARIEERAKAMGMAQPDPRALRKLIMDDPTATASGLAATAREAAR